MAELRIWTSRHSIRVAAPPKRVYQAIVHVDRWPELFDSLEAVEHLGFDGTSERIRFWKRKGDRLSSWTSIREMNPKRLQVRFRQEHFDPPLASMGGLWFVVQKGSGSLVVLDHYYRVIDDDRAAAERLERAIAANSVTMLESLRSELSSDTNDIWLSLAEEISATGGVTSK